MLGRFSTSPLLVRRGPQIRRLSVLNTHHGALLLKLFQRLRLLVRRGLQISRLSILKTHHGELLPKLL